MRLSTKSLTILYLNSMTSEFEKIYIHIYINKYIKSSDKALDSYKEKGIHWNLNLTKCTWILKYLLYLMTFILELHLSHRLY